jgi:hypothetical protein
MFSKKERSTFPYWFAHWCAFNMTALNLRVWKFKYLFHDIEKPWLMLLWRDYKRVQKYHRTHNRHHLEYNGKRGYDYMAMIIDWECSRLTKAESPMTARDETMKLFQTHPEYHEFLDNEIVPRLNKLGL